MSRFGHRLRGTTPVSQWLGASGLKIRSVQRGTISITEATSATATIAAVNTANTELIHVGQDYSTSSTDPRVAMARLELTNATTVTATVNTSPGAQVTVVSYEVIEYETGVIKRVQRGTITGAATATITAVDTTKSKLSMLGWTTTNTASDMVNNPKMVLTDATTVTQSGGVVTNITGAYQVIEFN